MQFYSKYIEIDENAVRIGRFHFICLLIIPNERLWLTNGKWLVIYRDTEAMNIIIGRVHVIFTTNSEKP